MSKRFPIPEFDRDQYKNMEWSEPKFLSPAEQARLIAAAQAGDEKAYGCYAVKADEAFYDRFKLKGQHRHVLMCLLPKKEVKLVGRSWAWPIQRALVVDSLDAAKASVVQEWMTPRPMNTRLGPDSGTTLAGGPVYLVAGHKYADHWIVNRTLVEKKAPAGAKGFGMLSATEDDNHDFHACNLSFVWS
jgi:hypothetical protein